MGVHLLVGNHNGSSLSLPNSFVLFSHCTLGAFTTHSICVLVPERCQSVHDRSASTAMRNGSTLHPLSHSFVGWGYRTLNLISILDLISYCYFTLCSIQQISIRDRRVDSGTIGKKSGFPVNCTPTCVLARRNATHSHYPPRLQKSNTPIGRESGKDNFGNIQQIRELGFVSSSLYSKSPTFEGISSICVL